MFKKTISHQKRQIKTIMRYHYTIIRMVQIKNKTTPSEDGKDVEKLDHSYTAAGDEKWSRHSG